MGYIKIMDGEMVLGLAQNPNRESNISFEEYVSLGEMIANAPEGKVVVERDGQYMYADSPEPEDEPTVEDKAEAYDILMGVSE